MPYARAHEERYLTSVHELQRELYDTIEELKKTTTCIEVAGMTDLNARDDHFQ